MFHLAPIDPQILYYSSYPTYRASPVCRSTQSSQVLDSRDQCFQVLVAAQEAQLKLQAAERLRREELHLRTRLREIEEQQVYARRSGSGYYHHQPLAFANAQLRNLERPSRLESLRREIEAEEQRQREEAQYKELLQRKQQQQLLRRKQQEEEAEYKAILRRTEALLQAKIASARRQPLPEPVPVKPRVQVKPSVKVCFSSLRLRRNFTHSFLSQDSREHVVFDPNSLFEAFFGHALEQPAKAEPSPPAKQSDPRLAAVEAIQSSFEGLRSTFVFPTEVSFNDSPANGNPISKLAYSSINKPIREYEQALNKLIGQLDEISSSGDETLRLKRKQAVLDIEKAIEELEGKIEARCVEMRTQKPSASEEGYASGKSADTSSDKQAHPVASVQTDVAHAEESISSSTDTNIHDRVDETISKTEQSGTTTSTSETLTPFTTVDISEEVIQTLPAEEILLQTPAPVDATATLSTQAPSDPELSDLHIEPAPTPFTEQAFENLTSPGNKPAVLVDELDLESATDSQLDESSEESDFDYVPLQSQTHEVTESDWSEIEA